MKFRIDQDQMLARFLRYVAIETTSDEEAEGQPSSACQWDLAKVLEAELLALGLEDVRLSEYGYVYGKLPSNLPEGHPRAGLVPAIGFISHMDVSPAVSGKDVKAIVHRNYDGGPIALPQNPKVVLQPSTDAPLGDCVGLDIVTADGTTLLGADDKAGLAIILTLLETLKASPELLHGPICVAFTPDEEVGRGVDHFDVQGFGAELAYTIDGESLGEVEDETFCADAFTVTYTGRSVHPGYAKGKMINALKLAASLVARLPGDRLSPETTSGREGFVHPVSLQGSEEQAVVRFIVRDFAEEGLYDKERWLTELAQAVSTQQPGSQVQIDVKFSYRNMKQMLDLRPEVMAMAEEAVAATGVKPFRNPIRGGTDGARLSFMGLPTPNIFTGGHGFHGLREWIAVQHMAKSAETCVHLALLWAEKGERRGLLPVAG